MESQDVDKGISDVMARSLTIDSPDHKNDDKPKTATQNGICENGEQLPHGSQHEGSNETSQRNEKHHENDPTVNLSDPNQVIELLNTVDLSEEDTEVLLQEAYTMNKKLKEMLRRQEQASPSANRSVRQRPVERTVHSKGSAASSQGGSRNGSASIASRTPLPPIKKEQTSIYTVKLRRSRTTVQDHSPTREFTIQRSKTKDIGASKKPLPRSKTTEPRPEWNDRFNYT